MDINKRKNRYANVIAYDHSRVVLQDTEGIIGGDYINANFCDGYRKHNAYVATQVKFVDWLIVHEYYFRADICFNLVNNTRV